LVKTYNESKELLASVVLNARAGKYGVDIPVGRFHKLEVLESGTVIFEVKEGPYKPLEPENIL